MFAPRVIVLALAAALSLSPLNTAKAQMPVIDPANLVQTGLTAARSLEQINNQIESLRNEARHLMQLGVTIAPELQQRLAEIDRLVEEARGIALSVQETRSALDQLFSGTYAGTTTADRALKARQRIDASREALKRSLILQAEVTQQIRGDRATLEALAAASQGAPGQLAATQATNEWLAFQAEQNARLQALLAAQTRAEALEQARAMEVRAAARAEHDRFFAGAGAAHSGARPWN